MGNRHTDRDEEDEEGEGRHDRLWGLGAEAGASGNPSGETGLSFEGKALPPPLTPFSLYIWGRNFVGGTYILPWSFLGGLHKPLWGSGVPLPTYPFGSGPSRNAVWWSWWVGKLSQTPHTPLDPFPGGHLPSPRVPGQAGRTLKSTRLPPRFASLASSRARVRPVTGVKCQKEKFFTLRGPVGGSKE